VVNRKGTRRVKRKGYRDSRQKSEGAKKLPLIQIRIFAKAGKKKRYRGEEKLELSRIIAFFQPTICRRSGKTNSRGIWCGDTKRGSPGIQKKKQLIGEGRPMAEKGRTQKKMND